jgi:hypothetical protein
MRQIFRYLFVFVLIFAIDNAMGQALWEKKKKHTLLDLKEKLNYKNRETQTYLNFKKRQDLNALKEKYPHEFMNKNGSISDLFSNKPIIFNGYNPDWQSSHDKIDSGWGEALAFFLFGILRK